MQFERFYTNINSTEMEIFSNFNFVQDIARQLIQPRPCNYMALDIWKHITNKELYHYESASFQIPDQRTVNIHLIQNKKYQNSKNTQPSTCIVYLHGLASFCVEGNFLVQNLEKNFGDMNVSVCLFDLRGHGKDKAPNITFGLKQSKQLCHLLFYLNRQKNYKQFVLWGRSMGATTILNMVSNFPKDLQNNSIQIKFMVLDSAFSSIEKVANEIISKKSGMPQIFCRPVFQYLVSTVQKLHNIKLVLDVNNFQKFEAHALFLYSETDNLVSSSHSKILFQRYAGTKQKIEMSVGHNQERPLHVLNEIFLKIRKNLVLQPTFELRRSISLKKSGLKVTKNKRVKTYQENSDQIDGSRVIKADQNDFNKQNNKPCNSRMFEQKINQNQKPFKALNSPANMNGMKASPKPFKIAKQSANNQKAAKKMMHLNGNTKNFLLSQSDKIKQNNLFKSVSHKRQQKLKLSHKDLVDQYHYFNQHEQRHRTSIYQKEQLKKSSAQPSNNIQLKNHQEDYSQFNQMKSAFLIRNQGEQLHNLQYDLKKSYMKKKYQQHEFIHKKLFVNQSVSLAPQNCCAWTVNKAHLTIAKPQSQNIRTISKNNPINHMNGLATPKKLSKDQNVPLNSKNTTNLRKNIDAQLFKQSTMMRENHNYLINSHKFLEKTTKNISFNFNSPIEQKSQLVHRLSNQRYI